MQEHVLQQVLGHSQPGHVCSLRDQPDGVQNVFVPQVAVECPLFPSLSLYNVTMSPPTSGVEEFCFFMFYVTKNRKKPKKTIETQETLILSDPSQFSRKCTVAMMKENSKNLRKRRKHRNYFRVLTM
jgi:hypothetical protein